jgi:hypothetical protein
MIPERILGAGLVLLLLPTVLTPVRGSAAKVGSVDTDALDVLDAEWDDEFARCHFQISFTGFNSRLPICMVWRSPMNKSLPTPFLQVS